MQPQTNLSVANAVRHGSVVQKLMADNYASKPEGYDEDSRKGLESYLS
ncbi:thymidylate synthase [Salmonella phage 19]|nr:thymidylate synthase [Salmonella phage 19]